MWENTILFLIFVITAISGVWIFFTRPSSKLHTVSIDETAKKHNILIFVVAIVLILSIVLPMGLSPVWNGEIPGHRNQYELTAEAFLKGQLHLDLDVDPRLVFMENPYSPEARTEAGASFYWDHAYYEGHYYMYFGVVPVILLFLPFRAITGMSLTTYHATQIFSAFFIIGMFFLFRKLAKLFFKEMPVSVYLSLSTALSAMAVWYATGTPALYCTAITSALCMVVWSLYFFIKAVYDETTEKKTYLFVFLGSLFGALSFGCRPSIALANVIAIPLLVTFLKKRKFSLNMLINLLVSVLPYVVIGVSLMLYNYARFENPFEFGQAYQLTVADQTAYGSIFSLWDWGKLFDGIHKFTLDFSENLPYRGLFIAFPVLFYILVGLENTDVRATLKEEKLRGLVYTLVGTVFLIIIIDMLWSPYYLSRYSMDVAWLFGIIAFIIIGFYYKVKQNKAKFSAFICFLSIWAVAMCFRLVLYPANSNFAAHYELDIQKIFTGMFS